MAFEAIFQIAKATKDKGVDVKIFVLSPNPNPKTLDFRGLNIHRSRSYFEIASCDFGGPDSLLQFNALVSWADVVIFISHGHLVICCSICANKKALHYNLSQ